VSSLREGLSLRSPAAPGPPVDLAGSDLAHRLRARGTELEEAIIARVRAILDPRDINNSACLKRVQSALTVTLDYAISAIERGERSADVPPALVVHARLAGRNGIPLDALIRCYSAGYSLFSQFVSEEAEGGNLVGAIAFPQLLRGQAALFDRLVAAVSDEHVRGVRSLVVISGPSKAGKSRTALEVAAGTLRDAWLLSPKSADAVAMLAKPWPPRGLGDGPCIIWIDDIEVCAHGQRGLNLDAMRAFEKWKRPVIVLATQGGKGLALSESSGFREIVGDLLARYPPLQLNPILDKDELQGVREMYPAAVERVAREGLGEFMIAAPRLIDRLRNGDSAAGRAIALAAIDCRRAGLLRPLSVVQLNELYVHYLVGAPHFRGVFPWPRMGGGAALLDCRPDLAIRGGFSRVCPS